MRRVEMVAILLLVAQGAHASVLRVPEDRATIAAAIAETAPGDTVLVSPGHYREGTRPPGEASPAIAALVAPITIVSSGGPRVTTIELGGPFDSANGRMFSIDDPDGDVAFEGFTFLGDSAVLEGHARAPVRFSNCLFSGVATRASAVSLSFEGGTSGLELEDCRFVDCRPASGSVVRVIGMYPSSPDLARITGCEFRECVRPVGALGWIRLEDCSFFDNSGPLILGASPGGYLRFFLEDCRFEGNRVDTGTNSLVAAATGSIARCFFRRNTTLRGPIVQLNIGEIVDCFFAGNRTTEEVVAVCARLHGSCRGNVFYANSGGADVGPIDGVIEPSGCNLSWGNPDGPFPPGTPSFVWVMDPQLCDSTSYEPAVLPTSPCATPPSDECGQFPLFRVGCAARGVFIDTDPPLRWIYGDWEQRRAPALFAWEEGTTHIITADDPQGDGAGTRFLFREWSDGGDWSHTIVAGPTAQTYVASFDCEFLLDAPIPPAEVGRLGGGLRGWHPEGVTTTIEITTFPPYYFVGWTGTGLGSYTGLSPVAEVTMLGPIEQVPHFVRDWPATFLTDPPGNLLDVDGMEFAAPDTFQWLPGSQHQVTVLPVPDGADGVRVEFAGWSDSVLDSARSIVMTDGPLSLTAQYSVEYHVTTGVEGEGTVSPETGWIEEGASVAFDAEPSDGWRFVEWIGVGEGSYSGPDDPVTLSIDAPISQTAVFEPLPDDAARIALSLSETSPDVAVSNVPLGLAPVHLWLVCQNGSGIEEIRARAAGSISVFDFVPAPGVVNVGTANDVDLVVTDCAVGARRLGQFTVFDPAGGDLCLESPIEGDLEAGGCGKGAIAFTWPTSLGISGVRSDGGAPCASGAGCGRGSGPVRAGEGVVDGRVGPVRPNPLADAAVVEFSLSRPALVRLDVFDVSGRRIRSLDPSSLPAGQHGLTWDRRGANGQRVPAGVYFVRLDAGRFTATRKAIVLE